MRLIYWILAGIFLKICHAREDGNESDGDSSRKILGSSVVTSVSVVMDTGSKKNAIFTDAVGKPQSKPSNPSELASPIDLLNPDRYEFYTFDDNGDLVKRLMSLEEIKSIIATGDSDALDFDSFTSQGFLPEKRVSDVVNNVQSVLKEEMEILKNPIAQPVFDTPDVSDSWSMILPAVFGNSGEDIKPEKPVEFVTPDTIMLEPVSLATQKVSATSTKRPTTTTTTSVTSHISQPVYYSSPALFTTLKPSFSTTESALLNVEILANSVSTTENFLSTPGPKDEVEIIIPTRAPIRLSTTTRAPLVRYNATTATSVSTQPPATTLKLTSNSEGTQTSSKPTTTSTTSRPTLPAVQTSSPQTSSRPSSIKPGITRTPADDIFGLQHSPQPRPSVKPPKSTTTPINDIFGLQTSSNTSLKSSVKLSTTRAPIQDIFGLQTSLRPSSAKPNTSETPLHDTVFGLQAAINPPFKISSTRNPIHDIFGHPLVQEFKNNLAYTLAPFSTTPVPAKSTAIPQPLNTIEEDHNSLKNQSTWEEPQLLNAFKEVMAQSIMENSQNIAPNTEYSSTIKEALNFEANKIHTSDLSTLSTEKLQQTTTDLDNNKDNSPVTKLPPLLNSLSDHQKLSASELLDQLLLTTNIYEINTELASTELHTRFDTSSLQEEQITTTDRDRYTTTDPALIRGIEELISQAVGDMETVLNSTSTEISPSQTLLSANKANEQDELLVSTTTETDSSTIVSRGDGGFDRIAATTTEVDENTSTTDAFQTSEHKEDTTTDEATYYYVIRTEPAGSTTENSLISNDSFVNQTKPAKSDLSMEQEVIAQEMKYMTEAAPGTIELNEILKGSETNIVLDHRDRDNDTTVEITTAEQGTTTEPYSTAVINDYESTTEQASATTEESSTATSTTFIPKPSIVITINEQNTTVFVVNKTIVPPQPMHASTTTTLSPSLKLPKNSTQDQTWTLVSTLAPQQASNINLPPPTIPYPEVLEKPAPVDLVPKPLHGFGLEETTAALDVDVHQFVQLCNELAFGFWKSVTTGLSSARSIFVSPFAATSMLAMVFLGAKGATSEEMNEILKLDDMVTFNPHLTFKSVSESLTSEPNSGVATTAMIRELFSDRSKGNLLDFYKNRVRAFYDGFVEEVSYREIGDVIRRRSNLLVKKETNGKYPQFFLDSSIIARSPLSGISINIFETDCTQTSTDGRDGELHFIVHPSIKQRRLVPIPAVVYKSGFLAGYEPSLDATAVAIGDKAKVVTTILVMPGQQGIAAPGDGLPRLEKRLVESSFKKGAWSRLLRSLIPRPGLEVQIPRFSHRSVINATNTLQRMGLHELFNPESADLRGLNGVANELHLSDVLQINKFATCGEKRIDETHHSEVYPATTMRGRSARRLIGPSPILDQEEPRDYQRAYNDPLHDPSLLELPLPLRPRQARVPEVPRLRFDRPFLYFVRHNPTGLILHMGRFNPRLLP